MQGNLHRVLAGFESVGDPLQVVDEKHDVGGLARHRRSARPHRHTNGSCCQHRSIIDTVADHHHGLRIQGTDDLHLLPGQALGVDGGDSEVVGNVVCGLLLVPGDHDGVGDSVGDETREGARGFFPDRIAKHDSAKKALIRTDINGGLAGFEWLDAHLSAVFGDEVGLPDKHLLAVDGGVDAVSGDLFRVGRFCPGQTLALGFFDNRPGENVGGVVLGTRREGEELAICDPFLVARNTNHLGVTQGEGARLVEGNRRHPGQALEGAGVLDHHSGPGGATHAAHERHRCGNE